MATSGSSQSAARTRRKHASTTRHETSEAITAAELDAKFDAGEDITPHLDLTTLRRPGQSVQRVNVDFPVDLLAQIDAEANRIGVPRQAFIKMRIADSLSAQLASQGGKAQAKALRPAKRKATARKGAMTRWTKR